MGKLKKLEKLEKLLSQEKLGCMYLVCEKAVFPVFPVFSVFPLKKKTGKTEKTAFSGDVGVYVPSL